MNHLEDKYEDELFQNVDYDYNALEFYLNDLNSSTIAVDDAGENGDDVLTNVSFQLADVEVLK